MLFSADETLNVIDLTGKTNGNHSGALGLFVQDQGRVELSLRHFESFTAFSCTLQEHPTFRTEMEISIISGLLKSMGGIFLGFFT